MVKADKDIIWSGLPGTVDHILLTAVNGGARISYCIKATSPL
ncbi:hypothetical protein [Pedobacter frigidisoli]|nr:hypothetical protein [Pedobacter frigidisoli]